MTSLEYDDRPEAATAIAAGQKVWSEGAWRELSAADVDRQSTEYRNARAEFRAECEHHLKVCFLCQKPIDYRLKYPHPDSWSLEHVKTVQEAPELFMDRNNWESSHLDCNRRRGTDEPHMDLGQPSELW
jgi:hypothetical protein